MFPIRTLVLTVALTLSTSVPLVACAQQAPAPQAQTAQRAAATCSLGWSYPEDEPGDYRRAAARHIVTRIESGQRVEEDWSWQGMPAVVGACNDQLVLEWQAAGMPDELGWLDSVAAQPDGDA